MPGNKGSVASYSFEGKIRKEKLFLNVEIVCFFEKKFWDTKVQQNKTLILLFTKSWTFWRSDDNYLPP